MHILARWLSKSTQCDTILATLQGSGSPLQTLDFLTNQKPDSIPQIVTHSQRFMQRHVQWFWRVSISAAYVPCGSEDLLQWVSPKCAYELINRLQLHGHKYQFSICLPWLL